MIEARYVPIRNALLFVEIHLPDDVPPADLPTVVCLHTAGQSGVQWRHAAPDLARAGYRVLVPDLPGHGRSEPAVDGPITDLGVYADTIGDLLDALGIDRPYVIGCSIGGKITLDLALRPDRPLAGAVALEADTAPGHVNVRGLRRELDDIASPSRADRTYLGTLASVGGCVTDEVARRIATMHKREDPEISSSDLIGWGTHDLRARHDRLTCPLHLAVGDQDCWVDADAIERTASELAAASIHSVRFTPLEAVGHYPMEEIENFGALAHRWLTALTSTSAVSAS